MFVHVAARGVRQQGFDVPLWVRTLFFCVLVCVCACVCLSGVFFFLFSQSIMIIRNKKSGVKVSKHGLVQIIMILQYVSPLKLVTWGLTEIREVLFNYFKQHLKPTFKERQISHWCKSPEHKLNSINISSPIQESNLNGFERVFHSAQTSSPLFLSMAMW